MFNALTSAKYYYLLYRSTYMPYSKIKIKIILSGIQGTVPEP